MFETTDPAARNDAIELLRGLAALAVALVHLTFGFARYVDRRIPETAAATDIGQTAVAAFFVVSGAVMVLAAGPRASRATAPTTFWLRRAIRVLPPYWIASGLFAVVLLWLGQVPPIDEVMRSAAFVPPSQDAELPFLPVLWPGWTLAFELVFYLVFGACLFAGRARAVGLCGGVLLVLVVTGWSAQPEHYALRLVTAPHLLLFVAGLGFGTFLARGRRVPGAVRIVAMLVGFAAMAIMPNAWPWPITAGLPGVCVFIGIAGGPLPSHCSKVARVAGAASYALYLLHVPFAHAWTRIFIRYVGEPGGSLGFLATGVPVLLILAWSFHRWIERPMVNSLYRSIGVARRA